MSRTIENCNNNIIIKLLTNIKNGISSMITDYHFCFTKKELNILKLEYQLINIQINKIKQNNINYTELNNTLKVEDKLKPLVFKCWQYESKKGLQFIHWYKKDKIKKDSEIISATFSIENSFCDSNCGITYEVPIEGFLAALNKDAATIIEDENKDSIYTIGKTKTNKTINSYNLATPIITPKQVLDISSNDYQTKYNEIILDSRYITPIKIIYTNKNNQDFITELSNYYHIGAEYITTKRVKK